MKWIDEFTFEGVKVIMCVIILFIIIIIIIIIILSWINQKRINHLFDSLCYWVSLKYKGGEDFPERLQLNTHEANSWAKEFDSLMISEKHSERRRVTKETTVHHKLLMKLGQRGEKMINNMQGISLKNNFDETFI